MNNKEEELMEETINERMNKKEAEVIKKINSRFKVEGEIQRERRIWLRIDLENLINLCNFIKEMGFKHLSAISVTDYVDKGVYELTYHIWSYSDKILITIKTEIPRDKPTIESVTPIWNESAQIHERELHELFGVKFRGNPDLAPLFLEDWNGPPPFRKDFNWREYVKEKHYDEKNEREKPYFV
ncbi:MAG: NADH-quinone oxidoreductase subunit C [Candidatus Altiarchaeales archaeon]|nr:NADH-quinone oxidoreductase subunit C [Candidatus Altiarchaeales archaeon]